MENDYHRKLVEEDRDRIKAERDNLREFVEHMLQSHSFDNFYCGDIDGGDCQDTAEALGIIISLPINQDNEADVEAGQEFETDKLWYIKWSEYAQRYAKENK